MSNKSTEKEQPLVQHLIELRTRLLHIFYCLLAVFLCMFPFSAQIYGLISKPLLAALPTGANMIATGIIAPFATPLYLTFIAALLLSVPFILYQIWAFIAPGLYKHEKQLAVPLLVSSVLLFFLGMSFAYFVVMPMLFRFTAGIALEGVTQSPDISSYLDLVLHMLFAFGAAFEIPVATVLLILVGVVQPETLAAKRRYVVVVCFVVGMVLTPPDIFSQTLLAIPMWMLFEAGLLAGRLLKRKARERESADTNQEQDS